MLWQTFHDPDAGADGASPLACNIIGALIGAAASLGGAAISASGASKAAKAQEAAAKINRQAAYQVGSHNSQLFQDELAKALAEFDAGEQAALAPLDPYATAGQAALNRLLGALGLPGGETPEGGLNALLASTPGYQFRLDQGTEALNRRANAGGNLYSGAQGKALVGYGQDLASDYWSNYLNELGGLTGAGQNAAMQGSGIMGEFAGSRANALLGTASNRVNAGLAALDAYTGANAQMGAARAGGAINQANAWSGGLNNLAQVIGFNKGAATPNANPAFGSLY